MNHDRPEKPPRGSVSAKHVAELAGVSRTAVSRTFTPGASVAPATRAKVLAAADALGYHVNHLARGLNRSESGIVALIVAELDTPFRSRFVASLTNRLQAAGKVAMLINTDRSDESVEGALRQAMSYRTDAAIVLSGRPDAELGRLCERNGMRLVLINRDEDFPEALHVRLDDVRCGEDAFEHLRKRGCSRPALATSLHATTSLRLRAKGFEAAARRAGVPITVRSIGPTAYATGRDLGRALLSSDDRPDGVFCTTDLLACGFMDAARQEFGLRIPEDLSVIGFDDIHQASWDSYRLTTFSQPIAEMCEACVLWLGEASGGRSVSLKAELIPRETA
ncbi:LacI family DNA-binding transcriptional regulator [Palleronia sp. LCG004]|uniref:LacI family DNA-binding transcriptional regulator n=1 Tax=Palleronia sp. LCG004 TaxID=3079304 RepID=UPI002942E96A|nr:LacI family DNA-binding transcriptional regulator [Palleronia sp. LCG004]WOI57798.1 LacI family DNA-binding transcriptional regulator [Palleronia sp. LCG004]